MRNYVIIFLCVIGLLLDSRATLFAQSLDSESDQNYQIKLLVVLIASDDYPVYLELQKVWRSYMHLDPSHVEAYFMKGDPTIENDYKIDGDVIWAKTEPSFKPGMIDKTLIALEAMLPRLHEFDYVLRTNLSSFYVFPRLLEYLKTLPKTGCCCGVPLFSYTPFASGAGIIYSPDLIELLISKKETVCHLAHRNDDVILGNFFHNHNIPIIPCSRTDILTLNEWEDWKDRLPDDAFHFRVKNPAYELRLTEDIYIHSQLLKIFYGITASKTIQIYR